jgi:uncharacterized protein YqeY
MSIKDQIRDDMKAAMKAGEKDKLGVIRMVSAAIKQIEVDERKELNDAEVLAVLDKMAKQRRESIKQFREGGREDLAAVEEAEIIVLQTWLPEQLSDAEIDSLVAEAISATGAEGMKDMGKVMGMLKPKLQGRADMGAVSGKIKAQLA